MMLAPLVAPCKRKVQRVRECMKNVNQHQTACPRHEVARSARPRRPRTAASQMWIVRYGETIAVVWQRRMVLLHSEVGWPTAEVRESAGYWTAEGHECDLFGLQLLRSHSIGTPHHQLQVQMFG